MARHGIRNFQKTKKSLPTVLVSVQQQCWPQKE